MSRKFTPRALGRNLDTLLRTQRALPSPTTRATNAVTPEVLSRDTAGGDRFENGLSDAIGYPSGGGMPAVNGPNTSEQVSDGQTIFKNLRWYMISNFRQVLSAAYTEIGLIRTIVDVPVEDALRGGVTFKSKQLEETQLEELHASFERDGDLTTVGRTAKWNRLYGGSGTMVLTDQDPLTPLDLDRITEDTPFELRAVDMWELFGDLHDIDDVTDVQLDLEPDDEGCFNYYGNRIHKSRIFKMVGAEAPSFVRPRLRGWGMSVVETLVRSINQYLKTTDLTFEVLDEFKLDVYKIKNLASALLTPTGTQKIMQRTQMANWQKSYQNAVVMDSEDDYDHKQLSFAGIAEAQQGCRMQVASDMRMPLTKLFGISASGFNSGEDDIEVYNGMVESSIREPMKQDILRIAELKCQKLFGFVPDDLTVHFKPLRVLSATDEETVKTQKFNRLLQAKERGLLTEEEFRDACNKGNLFDITLENTPQLMAELEDSRAEEASLGDQGGEGGDSAASAPPGSATGGKPKAAGSAPVLNSRGDRRRWWQRWAAS